MGNIVLLDLVGGIALLLWGLHMVQSGILRAFGADLRRFLGVALRNRFTAFLAGIGTTALLQSSTATALMTSTFVADGLVAVPAIEAVELCRAFCRREPLTVVNHLAAEEIRIENGESAPGGDRVARRARALVRSWAAGR